ncbi:hypothetical protein QBC35DRAFT_554239 [Podospora australis]|uniref:GATA-type domain-containing protein n=1 Tax=Podospora australis TaxID=1536484 RepID=A0AAN6WRE0_9PEZI|nr:hypothetical protein QBC35DRAFT_554239 [Podospora australis]
MTTGNSFDNLHLPFFSELTSSIANSPHDEPTTPRHHVLPPPTSYEFSRGGSFSGVSAVSSDGYQYQYHYQNNHHNLTDIPEYYAATSAATMTTIPMRPAGIPAAGEPAVPPPPLAGCYDYYSSTQATAAPWSQHSSSPRRLAPNAVTGSSTSSSHNHHPVHQTAGTTTAADGGDADGYVRLQVSRKYIEALDAVKHSLMFFPSLHPIPLQRLSSTFSSNEMAIQVTDKIEFSSRALFNFARQCSADTNRFSLPSSSSCSSSMMSAQNQNHHQQQEIFARLPEKRLLNMMSNNEDMIRRKLEDLHKFRKQADEATRSLKRAIPPSGTAVAIPPSSGSGHATTSTGKGWRRTRNVEVDGQGKKTIPARNPEGRCYQCNSEESTEWRRGPDGPRTLCNKCGLQFSKKEREDAAAAAAQGRR